MAKRNLKEQATQLRKNGMSYAQIRQHIPVSKGTLSLWLREFPLKEERLRELRDWNAKRIENFRKTMQAKRNNRLKIIYTQQEKFLFPLSTRDLIIGGLCLYWGEGAKTKPSELILSNTNPAMIRFFMSWIETCYQMSREKFVVRLQLYSDMDIEKEIQFWTQALNIRPEQFRTPHMKKSKSSELTYQRRFLHGTCDLMIRDVKIAESVLMGIQCIEDSFTTETLSGV
jgi:hypothetical protein